jgi:hypothetical protein
MNGLLRVWRLLNLPCEGMTRLASESLDRELGSLERSALRLHVLYCAACRRYVQQIALLRCSLRRLVARLETDDVLPGPDLPEDVRERIKRALGRG